MQQYLRLVKFSHTIFALPFALVGFFLGVLDQGSFDLKTLGLIILCMVFARNAAMSFNRWADRKIDAANPRTAKREIPAGIMDAQKVFIFCLMNCFLFIVTCYFINTLCFLLSPIALITVLGYSYAKRFTSMAHFILGIGLSLAPIGAYLAMIGSYSLIPVLFGLVVLTWVAGFDIIYALQDEKFDLSSGLHSVPSRWGTIGALRLSSVVHFCCIVIMIGAVYLSIQRYQELSFILGLGTLSFIALIIYQHRLVKPNDLSKINMAFFKTNGMASLIFGICFILDFYI